MKKIISETLEKEEATCCQKKKAVEKVIEDITNDLVTYIISYTSVRGEAVDRNWQPSILATMSQ